MSYNSIAKLRYHNRNSSVSCCNQTVSNSSINNDTKIRICSAINANGV